MAITPLSEGLNANITRIPQNQERVYLILIKRNTIMENLYFQDQWKVKGG